MLFFLRLTWNSRRKACRNIFTSGLVRPGHWVSFPGVKRPGRVVNYPPLSSAEVKERTELYLYSLTGPLWFVLGRTSPLPFKTRYTFGTEPQTLSTAELHSRLFLGLIFSAHSENWGEGEWLLALSCVTSWLTLVGYFGDLIFEDS